MADYDYILQSYNGNIVVAFESSNNTDTPLVLSGKNAIDWGDDYAQNFLNILENFAGTTSPTPVREGIIWYDATAKALKVYNGTVWAEVTRATVDQLTNSRQIQVNLAHTGFSASGSAMFNGSANATINLTMPTTLPAAPATRVNAAGFYDNPAITVNAQGIITGISNNGGDGTGPTTYVETFNNRGGPVILTYQDVIDALGYTPTNNGITTVTSSMVTTALGYVPANNSNVVQKSGDTMSGTLNMNGNQITNLPAPSSPNSPARLADINNVQRTLRMFSGSLSTSYNVTVSTSAPSGGANGDVWYRY